MLHCRCQGTDGPSGFGFELTFRLKREPGETNPPTWPATLMQALARYVFQTGKLLKKRYSYFCFTTCSTLQRFMQIFCLCSCHIPRVLTATVYTCERVLVKHMNGEVCWFLHKLKQIIKLQSHWWYIFVALWVYPKFIIYI